jgi:hypothetical protein
MGLASLGCQPLHANVRLRSSLLSVRAPGFGGSVALSVSEFFRYSIRALHPLPASCWFSVVSSSLNPIRWTTSGLLFRQSTLPGQPPSPRGIAENPVRLRQVR